MNRSEQERILSVLLALPHTLPLTFTMTASPLPITLLTGFLGSGKTTLLNHLLATAQSERIVIVVNEFGDVNIDSSLVVGSSEDLVELQNGCICCTIRGDLKATVESLLERKDRRFWRRLRFDRILIEASGVASPGPVAQTFYADPELSRRTRVDGVVALAHAEHICAQLNSHPEACQQIGYADRILLNHIDRVDASRADAAESRLRCMNPAALISRTEFARIDSAAVLQVHSADPSRWQLDLAPPCDEEHAHAEAGCGESAHTSGMSALTLRTTRVLDLHKVRMWLRFVCQRRSWELMRLKGVLHCRDHGPRVVVQGIYQWVEFLPDLGPTPEESLLVLIGRDLDHAELRHGWETVIR
jgi:G3E family GTPase